MKEKIENLIKEVGINEVESILQEIKSKVNVKEELKKDFIDLLTGCIISFDNHNDDIDYRKDRNLLFFYRKKDNYFYIKYKFWSNFESKYNLNNQELRNLLVGIVEEVLNYKGVTPGFNIFRKRYSVEEVLNYKGVTPDHKCFPKKTISGRSIKL